MIKKKLGLSAPSELFNYLTLEQWNIQSQLILSIGFFIVFSLKEIHDDYLIKQTLNTSPKFTRPKKNTFEKVLLIR